MSSDIPVSPADTTLQTVIAQEERQIRTAAILDVETTGLDPDKHETIEIGIILFQFDRLTGEILGIVDSYCGQQEPEGSISRDATAVHGLTKRMLKGTFFSATAIHSILGRAEFIIAHNAEFDRAFFTPYYSVYDDKRWVCSMKGINWSGYGYRSRALQKLLAAHKIEPDSAHRADGDCRSVLALLGKTSPKGQFYMKELADFADTIPVKPASKAAASAASDRPRVAPMRDGLRIGLRVLSAVGIGMGLLLMLAQFWLGLLFVGFFVFLFTRTRLPK